MSVVPFVPRAQRGAESKVVTVLRELLALALAGELAGFEACERRRDGSETIILAGYYEANPAEALRACLDTGVILSDQVVARRNAAD